MNIEELKKIVRGNGFQESHGSTTMVIDVETVIDLLDDLKQCDIPVVVVSEAELCDYCDSKKADTLICNDCFDRKVSEGA